MAEFFDLSTTERLEALNLAANISGYLPHLLEKDIWVVWSLHHLFTGPCADHLVFKAARPCQRHTASSGASPKTWT